MTDQLAPAKEMASKRRPRFSNESADYAKAREALLGEEIEVRRHVERLAKQLRELPQGPEMEASWKFGSPNGGEVGLADMFGPHDTLVLYFWMFGPERKRSCPMCTNLLGPLAANASDLKQRVALAVVSRSRVERMVAFGIERGWRDLPYYEALGDEFEADGRAGRRPTRRSEGQRPERTREFPIATGGYDPEKKAEIPVLMVLKKQGESVRLHWMGETNMDMADPGQDPRGAVDISPLWNILDLTPSGRDPKWYPKLSYG